MLLVCEDNFVVFVFVADAINGVAAVVVEEDAVVVVELRPLAWSSGSEK